MTWTASHRRFSSVRIGRPPVAMRRNAHDLAGLSEVTDPSFPSDVLEEVIWAHAQLPRGRTEPTDDEFAVVFAAAANPNLSGDAIHRLLQLLHKQHMFDPKHGYKARFSPMAVAFYDGLMANIALPLITLSSPDKSWLTNDIFTYMSYELDHMKWDFMGSKVSMGKVGPDIRANLLKHEGWADDGIAYTVIYELFLNMARIQSAGSRIWLRPTMIKAVWPRIEAVTTPTGQGILRAHMAEQGDAHIFQPNRRRGSN